MRDFPQFQADAGRDVAEGDTAQEARRQTDQNMNNQHFELAGAVKASGHDLTQFWADDPKQLAKSMFGHSVRSLTMIDTGSANVKELRSVSGAGASSFVLPSATLLDGAVFLFKNVVASTGAVTVNVYKDATNKVIDSASMSGVLYAGKYVLALYKQQTNTFELVDLNRFYSEVKEGVVSTVNLQDGAYMPASSPLLFNIKRTAVFNIRATFEPRLK